MLITYIKKLGHGFSIILGGYVIVNVIRYRLHVLTLQKLHQL
jgi:hypothetical protein